MSQTVYDFSANALNGTPIALSQYRGQVLLIVNTASQCGLTPQFEGLQKLHGDFAAKGLTILGFPCNQFNGQEPGDATEIGAFCVKNYGVDFQMFDKIEVNGKDAHPLYQYLRSAAPGFLGTEMIKWNFTKFLVNREGEIVKRYAPTTTPADIIADIEALL